MESEYGPFLYLLLCGCNGGALPVFDLEGSGDDSNDVGIAGLGGIRKTTIRHDPVLDSRDDHDDGSSFRCCEDSDAQGIWKGNVF